MSIENTFHYFTFMKTRLNCVMKGLIFYDERAHKNLPTVSRKNISFYEKYL
jgi:hypothetical protein